MQKHLCLVAGDLSINFIVVQEKKFLGGNQWIIYSFILAYQNTNANHVM